MPLGGNSPDEALPSFPVRPKTASALPGSDLHIPSDPDRPYKQANPLIFMDLDSKLRVNPCASPWRPGAEGDAWFGDRLRNGCMFIGTRLGDKRLRCCDRKGHKQRPGSKPF
jgi:hypothetical protein